MPWPGSEKVSEPETHRAGRAMPWRQALRIGVREEALLGFPTVGSIG